MVLNNVTKFHKILIKSIQFTERRSLGQKYVRTGVKLNAPAIVMAVGIKISPGKYHLQTIRMDYLIKINLKGPIPQV